MTENEAKGMLQAKLTCMELELLSSIEKGCDNDCDSCEYCYAQGTVGEHKKAVEMAIQALEKVQALEENETYQIYREYLAIGTVEELKSKLEAYKELGTMEELKTLKEKNTPKKVAYQGGHEKCPTCGSFHVFGNYCTECGQALIMIDWSE